MRPAAVAATFTILAGVPSAFAQETAVTHEDVTWARPDGAELLARIYRPERATDPAPVLIDLHGGAWNFGDRTSGEVYDRALATEGFVVIAVDFRQGPDHRHPAASRDVAAAVRWTRLNAEALGVDGERVGLVGSSSGGHLVMLAGLRPNAPAHLGTSIVGPDGEAAPRGDIDATPAYIVALWPVSDPAFRYAYAQRAGIDLLVRAHEAYYPDEEAMWDASVPRLVTAGEAAVLPPLLVVQPGRDSNIPQEMTFDLLRAYQARSGKIEYAFYPGQPHAFGHTASPETDDMVSLIADFARRRLRDGAP